MEPDFSVEIEVHGQTIEANRWNTSIFTYLGELACYDHIFVVAAEEEDRTYGTYIFNSAKFYPELLKLLRYQEFPHHMNLNDVGDCDVRAFEQAHYGDIESAASFPEDWASDGK